jgi:carbamoylphosphate synthase large subunit
MVDDTPNDRALYSEEHYVVLETDQPETLLTRDELRDKLRLLFQKEPDLIPEDVRLLTPENQVQSLLDTVCELKLDPGQYLQWYAIRLEK